MEIPSNCQAQDGIDVVSRFVSLLGSSARQDGNYDELKDQLSKSVKSSDVVCSLPQFRVVEEPKEQPVVEATPEPAPSAMQNLQEVLESSVRSVVFHLAPVEPKEEEPVVVDDDDESEPQPERETEFFDKFTVDTVDEAPLTLLRNLQDVFRQHSRSRLTEWKELLRKHPSHEAQRLVKLLTYHKMITGCRGNTRLYVVGHLDETPERRRDCEMGMESDSDTVTTSDDNSANTQLAGLAFRLGVELFVKIRHGPRTFATSSFTLVFNTLGTVRCKYRMQQLCKQFNCTCNLSPHLRHLKTR